MAMRRLACLPCRTLEPVAAAAPFQRRDLERLGLRGMQFGAGDQRHRACLNTDLSGLVSDAAMTEPGRIYRVDGLTYFIELDAARPLPFADGCIDWAYAEHFIEHLSLAAAVAWLREVRRLLAPGGILRLTTPDLRRYAEGYLADDGFFEEHRRRLIELGAVREPAARRAYMLNQLFHFHGHRWIYDEEELRHALAAAGFRPEAVSVRAFRQGALAEVAALDRPIRRDETIYVEAVA